MATPFVTLPEKVAVDHTAVIVIDMQNDFCAEKGAIPQSGKSIASIRRMIPALQQFLDAARRRGVTVIFVQAIRVAGDVSMPMKELWLREGPHGGLCVKGTWGVELIPEIQPHPGEIIINKTRYSAFVRTDLEAKLHDMKITSLIITGVATDVCVESTSRDAFMRDFYVIVPRDLVAGNDESLHDKTLTCLSRYFGTVTTSKDILQAWGM